MVGIKALLAHYYINNASNRVNALIKGLLKLKDTNIALICIFFKLASNTRVDSGRFGIFTITWSDLGLFPGVMDFWTHKWYHICMHYSHAFLIMNWYT